MIKKEVEKEHFHEHGDMEDNKNQQAAENRRIHKQAEKNLDAINNYLNPNDPNWWL